MSAEDCVGCRHINNCLGDCVGYEEVKPQEQTNEEWFCQLPTEEKADKLTDFSFWLVPTIPTDEKREQVKRKLTEWLKEKHND